MLEGWPRIVSQADATIRNINAAPADIVVHNHLILSHIIGTIQDKHVEAHKSIPLMSGLEYTNIGGEEDKKMGGQRRKGGDKCRGKKGHCNTWHGEYRDRIGAHSAIADSGRVIGNLCNLGVRLP